MAVIFKNLFLFAAAICFASYKSAEGQNQVSSCRDKYPTAVCKEYKARSICNYVKRSCALTCAICQAPPTTKSPACRDRSNVCPIYAKKKYCSIANVYSYCPLSCKACRVQGEWSAWSAFNACSAPCGLGTMSRTRMCSIPNKCPGGNLSTRSCLIKACQTKPPWSEWGQYGRCSATCGVGRQTRYRTCSGGKKCEGPSFSYRRCSDKACSQDDGLWSQCTRTCGSGTRYRFVWSSCRDASNKRCFRTFEECNTHDCPHVYCTQGEVYRYNSSTSCCEKQSSSSCGVAKDTHISGRIFNGQKAQDKRWPWMVYLNVDGALCGGTLVHREWVLTAGHCVKEGNHYYQPKDLSVHVGSNYLNRKGQKHTVSRIHLHPNYRKLQNDIALLKLSTPVTLSDSVATVCLPNGEEPAIDSTCFAIGWGLTEPNPVKLRPSNTLMEVGLKNLDINICRKAYSNDKTIGTYVVRTDNLLCAGSLSKRSDVCQGDSGGPLLCQRCKSCSWYVAGVTSFGPKGTCGKRGLPGMYTKVSGFEQWILSYIPSLGFSKQTCSGGNS